MKLYLMQHGEAMSKAENQERPLNEQGQANIANVAAFLSQAGIRINEIRHSGKCRAEQTATIVAQHLHMQEAVAAVNGLSPNDDVQPIADSLCSETHDILIVGHLPFLSRLASLLLTGDAEQTPVRFRNGGMVCLEQQEAMWSINWVVIPELFSP
jgi:phosphohistidine phosphatase